MTTDLAEPTRQSLRRGAHPRCAVCSELNRHGLGVCYHADGEGVQGLFECRSDYEGYPGTLHGGVVSCLLDGAMTHCLFAQGITGVTAELSVRFRHPVRTGAEARVRAHMERSNAPLYVLSAELVQEGEVRATATGKFMATEAALAGQPK